MPLRRTLHLSLCLALAGCAIPERDAAGPMVVAIGAVQGASGSSTRIGADVGVEGVVTLRVGDAGDADGGVFVQDAGDGDVATSDALFVAGPGVESLRQGDVVRVIGRVAERDTCGGALLTTLEAARVQLLPARALPAPMRIEAGQAPGEPLEGMRVRFDALHLDAHDDLDTSGRLLASLGEAPWQTTERARPGTDAARMLAAAQQARRVLLDDAGNGLPDPRTPWWTSIANARSGSVLRGLTGVVDQRDGAYRVRIDSIGQVEAAARPPMPRVDGTLRIAALNVENLFNGDGNGGGFPNERGARTQAEFDVQLSKQVATISALQADVVALMELENDGHDARSAEGQLVAALNAGGGAWRGVQHASRIGGDAIRVGIVYRSDRVRPLGRAATLTGGPFERRSRVPLAQAFVARSGGHAFVVVANHFKSKGCGNAQGLDADQGDGQSCFNPTRVDSAQRLHRWINTDPTGSGARRIALLGDFNAHAQEDPMHWLREAGWRDAFEVARVEAPYSYVYDGLRGRLDHALLNAEFARDLTGAAEWHVNADEPTTVGYRAYPQGAGTPWRGSDHDPLVLGFTLRGGTP